MKLHEISNNGSLTPVQIDWLASVIDGTYKVVDGKIDVIGDVSLPRDAESIPVQFGKITGYFDCSRTKITSLEGCPSEVGGAFYCHDTKITSLKGSPGEVGGSFSCYNTQITSLEGCPSKVGGSFYCYGANITSLIGVADNINQINGVFNTDWYKIKRGGLGFVLINGLKGLSPVTGTSDAFKIISKYLGKPDQLFDCQQELIEAGFEEYAIL